MELIYIHIDKYRNFNDIDLPISGKFSVVYNEKDQKIMIEKNTNYHNIYPSYISNVNAIVGKNSVGKTNLIDLIGMKITDRKNNNREREFVYKEKHGIGHMIPFDLEKEIRHASYFFIYYMGQDENNRDIYCFEGNNLEKYKNIVKNGIEQEDYYIGKDWFSLLCFLDSEKKKLYYKSDVSIRKGEFEFINATTVRGDYRSEQDKWSILSLRDNYNKDIYNWNSFSPEDDQKITIPRRIAKTHSILWAEKTKTLLHFMNNKNGFSMYTDEQYLLHINFRDEYYLSDNVRNVFKPIHTKVEKKFKNSCLILETYVKYLCDQFLNKNLEKFEETKQLIDSTIECVNTYTQAYSYLKKIIKIIVEDEYKKIILDYFEELYKELKDKYSCIDKNGINITLNQKTNINDIYKIIDLTLDIDYRRTNFDDAFPVVSNFFDGHICNLSDGENFYLGLFSSIYEQVFNKNFCGRKEDIILLFDEPESKMHPELSRNFINNLIDFLGLFSDNIRFQIIVSTHSPFILSDILQNNIIFLEKDYAGPFISEQKIPSTFGANIHDILKNGFFMNCTIGEFSKRKINAVIKSLTTKNNYPTPLSKEEIQFIISNIGEPILQTKLQSKFIEKYPDDNKESILEHIQFIEKALQLSSDDKHIKAISELYKIAETLQNKGE